MTPTWLRYLLTGLAGLYMVAVFMLIGRLMLNHLSEFIEDLRKEDTEDDKEKAD